MGRKKIVKAFGRFVDETTARMGEFMYPDEDHPLSASRMQRWVKSIAKTITMISTEEFGNDEDWDDEENVEAFASARALAMAIAFTKYANYVSVDEFRDAVKAVGEAVDDACRTGQFDEVVLVIPHTSAKSGTWVTVLLWPYFSRWVTDVVDSSYDLKRYIVDEKDVVTDKRVLAVVCDDAMYSGQQMLDGIVEAFSIPVGKMPRRDDFTYMIAVPFVSPRGMSLIQDLDFERSGMDHQSASVRAKRFKMDEKDNVVFALPDPHPKMRTLREHMADAKDYSVPRLAEHTDKTFEATNVTNMLLNIDRGITFFAHKLPDSVSIANAIFAGAPFLSPKKSQKAKAYRVSGFPLIEGCDRDDFTDPVGDTYRPGTNIGQFARTGVCPITWYKEQITYEVDGEKVRSYDNVLDSIKSSVRRDSDDESDDDDSDMGVRDRFQVGATITPDADAWWVDGGRIRSTKDNAFYCGHIDVPHRSLVNWLTKHKPMHCAHLCPACAEEDDTWRLPQ